MARAVLPSMNSSSDGRQAGGHDAPGCLECPASARERRGSGERGPPGPMMEHGASLSRLVPLLQCASLAGAVRPNFCEQAGSHSPVAIRHELQQRHRLRGLAGGFPRSPDVEDVEQGECVLDQRRDELSGTTGRPTRSSASPVGCSRGRCSAGRGPRRRALRGPPGGSWQSAGWRYLGGRLRRTVESSARRLRPLNAPVSLIGSRITSMTRCGCSLAANWILEDLDPRATSSHGETAVLGRGPRRHLDRVVSVGPRDVHQIDRPPAVLSPVPEVATAAASGTGVSTVPFSNHDTRLSRQSRPIVLRVEVLAEPTCGRSTT